MKPTKESPSDAIFNEHFHKLLRTYLATEKSKRNSLRNALVKQCMPYVIKISKNLARRSTDPVEDLIQVGSMGLLKALDKYNPTAGTKFKTYATHLITGEIRHYLRDKVAIMKAPRQIYELYFRMNSIVQQLSEELGRIPNDLEIAEALDCPVETVIDMNIADRRRTMISIDQFATGSSDSGETQFLERFVDERSAQSLALQEDRLTLEHGMSKLKPEYRQVIQLSYYEDLSQMEIASILNISQMQVSRRLRKALELLECALQPKEAKLATRR
jgi:RNA polymerase sigma-B factor